LENIIKICGIKMKVALVSDLHLEFADLDIKNTEGARVLVLAGDIMTAQELHDFAEDDATIEIGYGTRRDKAAMYRRFLKRCSDQFELVLYIAGNHEFYNGRWEQTLTTLRNECAKFNNVHFIENNVFVLDDVTFVGGTLWTDMNGGDPLTKQVVADSMNDYRIIRVESRDFGRLRPDDTIGRHIRTLECIRKTVDEDPTKKYFVIGHMAPSKLSTKPQYEDDTHINGAYSSNLSGFIMDRPQISVWVHGHTHHAFDYVIGCTRIVANPRGYVGYERDTQELDPYYPQIIEV
jgi:predicted phosphodiesterase